MQSTAKDVTAYIDEAPAERRPYLNAIRALALEVLQGYEEVMGYGMPGYAKNGVGEVGLPARRITFLYIS